MPLKLRSDGSHIVVKPPHERPPRALKRSSKDRRNPITYEQLYTDNERDFLLAIDHYKRENKRPFPAWNEILALLESLGWRRTEPPGDPPRFVRGDNGTGKGAN